MIAPASYAITKGLRHYRQIDTPERPEKKRPEIASAVGGSGQRPQ